MHKYYLIVFLFAIVLSAIQFKLHENRSADELVEKIIPYMHKESSYTPYFKSKFDSIDFKILYHYNSNKQLHPSEFTVIFFFNIVNDYFSYNTKNYIVDSKLFSETYICTRKQNHLITTEFIIQNDQPIINDIRGYEEFLHEANSFFLHSGNHECN